MWRVLWFLIRKTPVGVLLTKMVARATLAAESTLLVLCRRTDLEVEGREGLDDPTENKVLA